MYITYIHIRAAGAWQRSQAKPRDHDKESLLLVLGRGDGLFGLGLAFLLRTGAGFTLAAACLSCTFALVALGVLVTILVFSVALIQFTCIHSHIPTHIRLHMSPS